MFDSQQAADMLPCGHFAHKACIDSTSTPRNRICTACQPGRAGPSHIGSSSGSYPARQVPADAAAASDAGAGCSSSSSRPVSSAYISDLMDMLDGAYEASQAADVWAVLKELADAGLLPTRQVMVRLPGWDLRTDSVIHCV